MKTKRRRPDWAPPFAALELHRDQIRIGHRTPRRPGDLARDTIETAADWEKRACDALSLGGTPADAIAFHRTARAYLTGKSPRTRRGRWRRDLEYLQIVELEAAATLPPANSVRYTELVEAWSELEPPGFWARYRAARKQRERDRA